MEDDAILLETMLDFYPAHDGISEVVKGVKNHDAGLEVSSSILSRFIRVERRLIYRFPCLIYSVSPVSSTLFSLSHLLC